MFIHAKRKVVEPVDDIKLFLNDKIYLPASLLSDYPDRIMRIVGETDKAFELSDGNNRAIISKTDYLDSWYTQVYYEWVMSVFKEYDYLLGWCILERNYPLYNNFFKQVLKVECPAVWLIVKNKKGNKNENKKS